MNLFKEIDRLLKQKPNPPKCFQDENFMYCWCGKCKQKDYELPEDFKKLFTTKVIENYKLNNKKK
jgi:hypothetical protein